MPTIDVYDLKKSKVGSLELSPDIFEGDVNEALLYDVVKAQLASRRSGTAKSKGRSEVRGTTKKMYKQKGTGRARHGNELAPSFVGGGTSHGPLPRDYSYRPTRKMRIGALKSALRHKLQEGKLIVLQDVSLGDHKTKTLASSLVALGVSRGAMIVDAKGNEQLRRSARNLPKALAIPPEGVNVYDMLRHDHLLMSKAALEEIQGRILRDTQEEV